MQKTLLLTFAIFLVANLSAQIIDFEVDTNCGFLENSVPVTSVMSVDLVIATSPFGTTTAAAADLADRTTYVSFPMADPDGDKIYNLDFNPNGTIGNIEMRWYFQVTYDDPMNPGTTLTANEFLNTEVANNAAADMPFFACDVNFGVGGPTRGYYVNGPQDRHIRSALGRCIPCGGSEWRVNMDYSNAPDNISVLDGQISMGNNRYLSYNGSFLFVPLVNTTGDIYSMRFPTRSAGDFFVGSFHYDFGPAESTFLAEGTAEFVSAPDQLCNIFEFGARSNFTPANTIKVTDYLWGSWETSTPGTAIKPFAAGTTVTANQSYLDPDDGFTYYMANSSHLIGIDWGSETPAAASDVSITFGSAMATFYSDGTGFIDTDANATGAALMGRTWDVANTTISNDVTVRFFYSRDEFDAMNAEIVANGGTAITDAEMSFYKVTSAGDPQNVPGLTPSDVIIINPGGISTTTFAEGDLLAGSCDGMSLVTRTYADFQVSSFSGGGGGGANMGSALLPVELAMLEANAVKQNVVVKWATVSESGNEGFDVQHSSDGATFRTIGHVAGAGQSTDYHDYSFEHLNAPEGINFYRLLQRDFDGNTNLSQVVSTRVSGADGFSIYPNPVKDELTLAASTVGFADIHDSQGRLISTLTLSSERQTIDLRELQPGLYFVTLRDGETTATKRFLKK